MTEPVDRAAAPPAAVQGRLPLIGREFSVRAAAAVVMAALALVAAWIGGFWFMAFWFAAAAIALWEWQRLIGGERLLARLAVGALTLLAVAPLALHGAKYWTLAAMAIGALAAAAAGGGRGGRAVWTGAGVFYAAAILAAPTLLEASPAYGFAAILWLFAVVWGADTFAFLGGRLIGGPRLWRRVSPGKTWSGAFVGTFAGAAAGAIVGFLAMHGGVRLAPLFWLGAAAAIVGQIGDLAESAIKRRFTVKDSSRLIPGHGGVLDRLDAFVAAAVFAALVGWARGDGVSIAAGLFQW
jgi:phosphatidate cytidylyltransferase